MTDKKTEAVIAVLVMTCVILLTGTTVYALRYNEAQQTNEVLAQHVTALENDKDLLAEQAMRAEAELNKAQRRIRELEGMVAELTEPLVEPSVSAYDDIGWDFDYVVRVVGAEARGEPFEGILAVCECIANTAADKGVTPEEVVKVPGQYASPVGRDMLDGMEDVNEACLRVFLNGERPHGEPIKYFYAFRHSYSSWHEGKTFCYEIGGHRYFKD